MGYSSALIIRMSLFCIVWSKNSHRTCISVGSSALSSSSAESVQRQNMKALNTHRHTYTHSQNQSVSFWNTYICKHTLSIFIFLSQTYHIHKQSHTDTLKKSLWSYILFAVSGCAGCLWTYLHSVCAHARRESISVHMWSPKCGLYVDKLGLLSVYLREYIRKFLVSYK